ncbi:MAG: pyridoxal-phosphate dependent enzyme [Synergistetes bacterium]|nr:pyridoxal-phosphate dependent enzyme [Synergistota bacterium]
MNKRVFESIASACHETPMVRLRKIQETEGISGEILAKIEYISPSGSMKDRIAYKTMSFPVKIIMPEEMSKERRKIIEAFGAELILTPGCGSDIGLAVKKLKEIISTDPERYFVVSQFDNSLNPLTHYETTGPEIWEQTNGEIDASAQGIGTGGSLSGIAKFLKEKRKDIKNSKKLFKHKKNSNTDKRQCSKIPLYHAL